MQDFDYILAHTVEEVTSLLSSDGKEVAILAGGTDLLVQLREHRRRARLLVDIKALPELNEIRYDPRGGLLLGAATPCLQICANPEVSRVYPGLIDAVSLIGGVQIQGRATLGGNLCNASPAADSTPALIVHRAACIIAGPDGRREVPVEDFCTAPGQTVLRGGEFLVAFHLPAPNPGFGAAYLRFIPRNEMDIAVVGAGAAVQLDEGRTVIQSARVALGAVAPTPLFVREAGERLAGCAVSGEALEAAIREASDIAKAAARPINDMRGTIAQRRHLSGVLTCRAIEKSIQRARTS